jgi:hypothetical protein
MPEEPDDRSSTLRAELERLNGHEHDAVLDRMLRHNLPLTREVYLGLAYGHERPKGDAWTAEHEEQIPEPFRQDTSKPD